MPDYLKWKEPRAVSRWEFRHEDVPKIKNLYGLWWKWSFILGLPVLLLTWRWAPQEFNAVLNRLCICGIVLPGVIAFQVWAKGQLGIQCRIGKKGITRYSGDTATRYRWEELEAYRFEDYPHVHDVRVLRITVHQGRRIFDRDFRFSPDDVNEQALADLLHQHMACHPLV